MKSRMFLGLSILIILLLVGCSHKKEPASNAPVIPSVETASEEGQASQPESEIISPDNSIGDESLSEEGNSINMEETMQLLIENTTVPVTWDANESVEALKALVYDEALVIHMSMYGGFEQVGSLGQSIVRNDQQTNTAYGDIVLYSGNQIVIFYGSNSWAYTRLGHINLSQEEMTELLGNGDVTITFK